MARVPAQIQPRRRWFDDANVDDTLGRCDDADVTVGRYLYVNPDRVRVLHLGDLGDVAITIGCDLGLSGIHDARGQYPRPPGGALKKVVYTVVQGLQRPEVRTGTELRNSLPA